MVQPLERKHCIRGVMAKKSAVFSVLLFGVVVGIYLLDPLDLIITWQTTLSEGTVSYRMWQKPPEALFLRVYVFNVTNPDAFLYDHERLKVEEIGPFIYREVTTFKNLTVHPENGTASFRSFRRLEFVPEQSIGDPSSYVLTIPNLPLLGVASMLASANLVTNLAFRSAVLLAGAHLFVRLSAHDLFWGYHDPLIVAAHRIVPSYIDFQQLGLLDRMFAGEDEVTMRAFRNSGVDPSTAVAEGTYSLLTYNRQTGFPQWGHGVSPRHDPRNGAPLPPALPCDTLSGSYEGIMFPRKVMPGQTFHVYRRQFCRTVPVKYVSENETEEGYRYLYYEAELEALTNPDSTGSVCYCASSAGIKGACLPAGFSAAGPCYYQLPLMLSLPHMMFADERYQDKIEGQKPNASIHTSFFKLQPDLGVPLEIRCRLQVNLFVPRTRLSLTERFNDMALPFLWIDMELSEMPQNVQALMWMALKFGPAAIYTLQALLATAGVALAVKSLRTWQRERRLAAAQIIDRLQ